MLITETIGKSFGFVEVVEPSSGFSGRQERVVKDDVQIDRLGKRLGLVGEMGYDPQRLLKIHHRLAVGRARHRLVARLATIQ